MWGFFLEVDSGVLLGLDLGVFLGLRIGAFQFGLRIAAFQFGHYFGNEVHEAPVDLFGGLG